MFRRLFYQRATPSDSAPEGMPVDHGDRPRPGPGSPVHGYGSGPEGGFRGGRVLATISATIQIKMQATNMKFTRLSKITFGAFWICWFLSFILIIVLRFLSFCPSTGECAMQENGMLESVGSASRNNPGVPNIEICLLGTNSPVIQPPPCRPAAASHIAPTTPR